MDESIHAKLPALPGSRGDKKKEVLHVSTGKVCLMFFDVQRLLRAEYFMEIFAT